MREDHRHRSPRTSRAGRERGGACFVNPYATGPDPGDEHRLLRVPVARSVLAASAGASFAVAGLLAGGGAGAAHAADDRATTREASAASGEQRDGDRQRGDGRDATGGRGDTAHQDDGSPGTLQTGARDRATAQEPDGGRPSDTAQATADQGDPDRTERDQGGADQGNANQGNARDRGGADQGDTDATGARGDTAHQDGGSPGTPQTGAQDGATAQGSDGGRPGDTTQGSGDRSSTDQTNRDQTNRDQTNRDQSSADATGERGDAAHQDVGSPHTADTGVRDSATAEGSDGGPQAVTTSAPADQRTPDQPTPDQPTPDQPSTDRPSTGDRSTGDQTRHDEGSADQGGDRGGPGRVDAGRDGSEGTREAARSGDARGSGSADDGARTDTVRPVADVEEQGARQGRTADVAQDSADRTDTDRTTQQADTGVSRSAEDRNHGAGEDATGSRPAGQVSSGSDRAGDRSGDADQAATSTTPETVALATADRNGPDDPSPVTTTRTGGPDGTSREDRADGRSGTDRTDDADPRATEDRNPTAGRNVAEDRPEEGRPGSGTTAADRRDDAGTDQTGTTTSPATTSPALADRGSTDAPSRPADTPAGNGSGTPRDEGGTQDTRPGAGDRTPTADRGASQDPAGPDRRGDVRSDVDPAGTSTTPDTARPTPTDRSGADDPGRVDRPAGNGSGTGQDGGGVRRTERSVDRGPDQGDEDRPQAGGGTATGDRTGPDGRGGDRSDAEPDRAGSETRTEPATTAPPLSWQEVDGGRVTQYTADPATGTTVAASTRPDATTRTDTYVDGGLVRLIEREDGTSRVETTDGGTTRIAEYDADGQRISRDREQASRVVAPELPAPDARTGAAPRAWTQTDRDGNRVEVVADPRSGTTTATSQDPLRGTTVTRWNPDDSVTAMRTTPRGRLIETSIDPRGREVSRTYADGELVDVDSGRTDLPEEPTVDRADLRNADSTTYVTRQGERAELETLADGGQTLNLTTLDGRAVERTVTPEGAGLVVTDDGEATTYRRVDERGRGSVVRVDNATGETRERALRGARPVEAVEVPGYVRRDDGPRVRTTEDGTVTRWDDGTRLVESTTAAGDVVVQTRRPDGQRVEQLVETDGDVVTRAEDRRGDIVLHTRTGGTAVSQELPEPLRNLPVAAVEAVATDEAFTDVTATAGAGGRERVEFAWDDWDVTVRTGAGGVTTWRADADDEALDAFTGDGEDAVEMQDVDVSRTVDRSGDLVERTEQRVGDDGDSRAEGRYTVQRDGGTLSTWDARDDNGTQSTSMQVAADGSIVQVSELDPDFGPGYRTEMRQDADGDVVTDIAWDESDIGNGVTTLRARSEVDGDGFVRFGRLGPDETDARYVYTDVAGRFDDGRPTLDRRDVRRATRDGAVVVDAERADGAAASIVVPDWALVEIGDGLAVAPGERFAEGTGEGGPEVADAGPGPWAGSGAPQTVARWVGREIAEGFGADDLAAGTAANAAAGAVALASGDPTALRTTAGAVVADVVADAAGGVFTNEWAGAASAAGTIAGKLVTGTPVDPVDDIAAPVGGGLIADAAGSAVAGQVGAGVIRLAGDAIFGGEVTGEEIMGEALTTGAGAVCGALGAGVAAPLCYGVGSLLFGLLMNEPEPDDLATEFGDEYEDQRFVRHNPFANLLETARSGDGAHEELWEFQDDVNLAGGMEFNPDQEGQLTRQAYLATTDPLTTERREAQRREDYARLADRLAEDHRGLRPVAQYLQASAEFVDQEQDLDENEAVRTFREGATRLGLDDEFGVRPLQTRRPMSRAEAQVAVDEIGWQLGYGTFNPFRNSRLDPTELPVYQEMPEGIEPLDEETIEGFKHAGRTRGDYFRLTDDELAEEVDPETGETVTEQPWYVGTWWRDIMEVQDRFARGVRIPDVVSGRFDDYTADQIRDMEDEAVYQRFLRPTYKGLESGEDEAARAQAEHEARSDALIDLVRESGRDMTPEEAAQLIADGRAGMVNPAYFAPEDAPLIRQDSSPSFDWADGIANILLPAVDVIDALTPARSDEAPEPAGGTRSGGTSGTDAGTRPGPQELPSAGRSQDGARSDRLDVAGLLDLPQELRAPATTLRDDVLRRGAETYQEAFPPRTDPNGSPQGTGLTEINGGSTPGTVFGAPERTDDGRFVIPVTPVPGEQDPFAPLGNPQGDFPDRRGSLDDGLLIASTGDLSGLLAPARDGDRPHLVAGTPEEETPFGDSEEATSDAQPTLRVDESNPWRFTLFDEGNFPPELEITTTGMGFAGMGIPPTVALTAVNNRIPMSQAALTLFRSVPSDTIVGGFRPEIMEGERQNALAGSVVNGALVSAADVFSRQVADGMPEMRQRNVEFWLNRDNTGTRRTVPLTGRPQINSGLHPATMFAIPPTIEAFRQLGDATCDHLGCNYSPDDPNNNRYYAWVLRRAAETGAGVFLPIATEMHLADRARLRPLGQSPSLLQSARNNWLAFGIPAVQSAGADIIANPPPDRSDPIYRGTRAVAQFTADQAGEFGDMVFGDAREEDGNEANSTRAIGNAGLALAGPVLDAIGRSWPTAFADLGNDMRYLFTGERHDRSPIVSPEALDAAEEARARAQEAWRLTREGEPTTVADASMQVLANGIYSLGRSGIGVAHQFIAPFVDPFQSYESRLLDEPTQAERARESFTRAGQGLDQLNDGLVVLRDAVRRDDPQPFTATTGFDRAAENAESLRRSGLPLCGDAAEVDCIEEGSIDLDDPSSVGMRRVGRYDDDAAVTVTDAESGRSRQVPLCSVPGEVECVDRYSIDPENPSSVGHLVRGSADREMFTDRFGRQVQYPDCSTAFEVQCLTPGTSQLRVGSGRDTERLPDGRIVERVNFPELVRQVEAITPQQYQRAFEEYYAPAVEAGVPFTEAGTPSPALVAPIQTQRDAVRSTVDYIRNGVDNVRDWVDDNVPGPWNDWGRDGGDASFRPGGPGGDAGSPAPAPHTLTGEQQVSSASPQG